MVEVSGLTKKYGDILAVNNISFSVAQGEILGFLGPNGAGKTTTMNIITGYLSCTEGKVTIGGHDILDNPYEARARIGFLPEQPPLYMEMTVKEYLSFVYELKKLKLPKAAHIKDVCELVKISDVFNRLIRNLSKGYKQRVGLAGAMLGNPDVLILDEPTVGLDPKQIIEIRSLIKRLGKKHTIILSSHILSEVQAICDRVIIINRGEIVADDTTDNLSKTLSNDFHVTLRVIGNEEEILGALRTIPEIRSIRPLGVKESGSFDFSIDPSEGKDARRAIFERLSERHLTILGMMTDEMSLEDIFLKLTRDDIYEGKSRRGRKFQDSPAKKGDVKK